MTAVDPLLHPGVVLLRHKHRQREVVQQTLRRPLPRLLAIGDTQQLTGEGQLGDINVEILGDALAQLDL